MRIGMCRNSNRAREKFVIVLNIANEYGKLRLPRRHAPLANRLTHTDIQTHTSVLNCILITILLLMLLLSPPTYFRLRCPSLSHPRPRHIYNRTYLSICIHTTKYVCPYVRLSMFVRMYVVVGVCMSVRFGLYASTKFESNPLVAHFPSPSLQLPTPPP